MINQLRRWCLPILFVVATLASNLALAQPDDVASDKTIGTEPVKEVAVQSVTEDSQIAERLAAILTATNWFREVKVKVDKGVAFLDATAAKQEHKEWATQLANKTEDVVAVVNRMRVDQPNVFDFSPAAEQFEQLTRESIQALPGLGFALALIAGGWLLSWAVAWIVGRVAQRRTPNLLLQSVVRRAAAIPVLILGIYLALRVTGLTQLAATILGGTGLLGIVIGIAFRDIAENFLASILISIQRPFAVGQLVRIDEHYGYVQAVTTRGTQLMTLDGNHVQIPNSTIYKSIIVNETANPNMRLNFVLGIGYADAASAAQAEILSVLREHDAVLSDPEPLVLVDDLASSTVNLRIYFWIDTDYFSPLKVRSALLRAVKRRMQERGFTMPDEAREMIFPEGVPVVLQQSNSTLAEPSAGQQIARPSQPAATAAIPSTHVPEDVSESSLGEGNLQTDRKTISEQAARSRRLSDATNLLDGDTSL